MLNVRMTFIARLAVVLIALLVPMFVIHLDLIVLVTQNAFEDFVIRRIHVASRACLPFAAMLAGINTEILAVVIERCRRPRIHRVARGAIMREIQCHVIGIRGPLEIRLMAGEAIRRRTGKAIVHVTLRASRRRMRAEQRKARFVVIERRGLPGARGMARSAIAREIGGHMIGIGRALEIALMTREAIRRRARKTIVRMALIARHREMRAGERKARAAVIETAEIARAGNLPTGDRAAVAYFAAQRKTGLFMIRIRCDVEIFLMTRTTLQRQIDKLGRALCRMAIIAADMLM